MAQYFRQMKTVTSVERLKNLASDVRKDSNLTEKDLEQKVWSSYMSKTLVEDVFIDSLFDGLENEGVFRDPVRRSVEEQFMPWVLQMVGGNLDRVANSRRLVDSALERALEQQMPNEATLRASNMEMAAKTSEGRKKEAMVSGHFDFS